MGLPHLALRRSLAQLAWLALLAAPARSHDYGQQESWAHFSTQEGLPGRVVTDVTAADGTRWAATENGVAWFDGWRWTPADGRIGVPPGRVQGITAADDGALLITTGATLLRGTREAFEPVDLPSSWGALELGDVAHSAGRTYLAVRVGPREWRVGALDADGREIRLQAPLSTPLQSYPDLAETRSGRIWVGLLGGLYACDPGEPFELVLAFPRLKTRIGGVVENEDGTGWLGLREPIEGGGLWAFGPGEAPRRLPAEGAACVHTLSAGPGGELIVSYESGVVREGPPDALRDVTPLPEALLRARSLRFLGDELWAAGPQGLYLHRGGTERWTELAHPGVNRLANRIHEYLLEEDGSLTVATADGVSFWARDGSSRRIPPPFGTLVALTGLARDRDGRLWASSGSEAGLFRLDGEAWTHIQRDAEDQPIGFVHRLRTAPDGRIWCTELAPHDRIQDYQNGGLLTIDGERVERYREFAEAGLNGRAYDVLFHGGDMWVATGSGLARRRGERWKTWTPERKNGTRLNFVALALAPDGAIWFSNRHGVGSVNGDDRLALEAPLSSETRGIAVDADGRVWVTTSDGLAAKIGGAWTRFGRGNGLKAESTWPVLVDGDRLLVGTRGAGVQILNLNVGKGRAPTVTIDEPAVLADGAVQVGWTVNDYGGGMADDELRSRWRLDGGEWSAWGPDRRILLADGARGRHVLEVEAIDIFGAKSPYPARQSFEVPPPLFRTPKFLLPLLGLLAALIAVRWSTGRRLRRSAEALRESESELRLLFEGAHDAILVFEAGNRRVTHANERACELFGREEQELVGMRLDTLFADFPGYEGGPSGGPGEVLGDLRALRPGRAPVDVEAGVRLVSSERGLVMLRDLTERRRLERERRVFERRLSETQRLESLGRLAGGIAHDFNNLLMILGGSADQARRAIPSSSRAVGALNRIQTTCSRGSQLTQQLLAVAGRRRMTPRPVDLNGLIGDLVSISASSMPPGSRLDTNLADDLPAVYGDAGGLQQVLLNLILNAADALGSSGTRVTVSTRPARPDDVARAVEGTTPESGIQWIALEVRDDGIGMDAETRRHIFDPFFSTKPEGRGLGLPAVRGIVRSLSGGISISSEPGQGARFTVVLPSSDEPATRGQTKEAGPAADTAGRGTALVVDDEPAVRQVLRGMLEDLGFTVREADGGLAAVATHEADAGEIDFTLLDLSMPDLGGIETRRRIHELAPEATVILMSGFSESTDARLLGDVFLQKPFLQDDIVRCLAALPR